MSKAPFVFHRHQQDQKAARAATLLAADLSAALKSRDKVVFLASGGRSPGAVLVELSKADLDWDRVLVSLTDDRRVSPDHRHSNAKLVREALFRNKASKAQWVPLWRTEDRDAGTAEKRLAQTLGPLAPFDVALVGMGLDGHFASIFPAGEGMKRALTAEDLFVGTTPRPLPPQAPWPRITITLKALASANSIHLLLFGDEKRKLFDDLLRSRATDTPITELILASKNRVSVHTDT